IFLGNQPTNSANAGEVSIGGKIGVLILLRVSGDIEEKGGLLSFETKDKQRFFSTLPVNFEYKLNNLGGDRVVPNGEIKIKNSFWLTSATLLANKNEGSVLPSSARKFEVVWEDELENVKNKKEIVESEESGFFSTAGKQLKDFHLGFYTAKLNITWGETNQTAKDSFLIFIFPWQLLTIVLFILIIIGFLGRKLIYRYNRWIIAQARANMMNMERYSEPVKTIHPQVKRKRVVRKKIENE
ncbi:MAG: hypothetical protein RLY43_1531, partial [Bacteroidota bacterium]